MEVHQNNLKYNIRHFFKVLDEEKNIDYRMGIVTTGLRAVMNEENGQPTRLLSGSNSDDRRDFMKKLLVGIHASPDEKGTEAILRFMLSQDGFV